MAIIDISRTIAPSTAVWPGDQPFEQRWTAQIGEDSPVNIGAVRMSTHAGTHADAPLHFEEGGLSIDELPLSAFVGPAVVVSMPDAGTVRPDHLTRAFSDSELPERVLFKTSASRVDNREWDPDFAVLDPEAIEWLAARNVVLVGTDAPSVDPPDSTDLPAHHALADHDMVNLENLALQDVLPGIYTLVALPLKMTNLDAAPVRAVLITEDGF